MTQILFSIISVVLFCYCAAASTEVVQLQDDLQDLPCILPVNYDEDPIVNEIVNAMNSSVLYKTPTTTIAIYNNNITFTVEYDLAVLHHLGKISKFDIIAYINGSKITANTNIPFITCHEKKIIGNVLSRTCVFYNTPLYPGNNTKVQFWLVYENTIQVCQPKSILFIEEKPLPVPLLNYTVDTCKGISLTFPYVPSDTHVTCTIYNSDDELVYNNTDCDNSTNIPAIVFSNHTGHYTIVTESVKTVARGEKRNKTIVLKKENIRYNVTMIGIEVLSDEFYARFLLEMCQKCSLSQPNYVIISSNTSDRKQYNITGTTVGNTLEIKHKIYPYMKHLTFTIEDSSGKIINRTTNKSSFNVQQFNHEELPGSLVATFGFTPGSTLKELILNMTSSHSNRTTKIIVTRPRGSDSLIVTEKISPFPAGMYDVQVIERGNKTVFDTHISIPSPSVSISVTTATTTITTSINTTVTETVKGSSKANKNYKNATSALSFFLVIAVIALVIALLVIGFLCYRLYKAKKFDYNVIREAGTPPLVNGNNSDVPNVNNGSGGPNVNNGSGGPKVNNGSGGPNVNNGSGGPNVNNGSGDGYEIEPRHVPDDHTDPHESQNAPPRAENGQSLPEVSLTLSEPTEQETSTDKNNPQELTSSGNDRMVVNRLQPTGSLDKDQPPPLSVEVASDDKSVKVHMPKRKQEPEEVRTHPRTRSVSISSQNFSKVNDSTETVLSLNEDGIQYDSHTETVIQSDKQTEYIKPQTSGSNNTTTITSDASETEPLVKNDTKKT